MRRMRIMVLAVLGASCSGTAAPGGEGFVPLWNGRDLSGWTTGPDNAWVVEDGVLALKNRTDGKEHNADYLWTKEPYGDFILELEFKIPEQANSGVFFRTSDLKDPVYTGFEMQVANSFGREQLSKTGTAGAIYDCQAPSRNAIRKPGEWNQVRLTCRGGRIEVVLNGEAVVDMDLDRWTDAQKNPDGSKNKFPRAMKDFARSGHIGLQDHGRPVWYRNLRIKRL